jgi:hypothetical protein
MAKSQFTRRKSSGKRPSPDQVRAIRRMAEDTGRVYHELRGDDDHVLNSHVELLAWLRQFDNGVYADDPPALSVARKF